MSLALYRRYRPETFAEVIGQEHVTEPLQQAIRNGRVNHAYLFSGPRGCGKTTSARILARALNCGQGPTPTPCGVCQSCRDLARGGGGGLDVIEIDAASHGGVDDARDLRDRVAFAPASARYKIYIIDEAHMVTTAGFNALLKVVEEPPEHVKFVFATTEPEKVIPTIRSRTHHYPFRLVPPGVLREYLAQLCEREQVAVEPAVLPLVVRAGAGSVRDSLSVLDQLIAGAGAGGVTLVRATALLGYTDAALLDDVVDAFAAHDGAAVFELVDRVIEGGHDPRRFVQDLLERLRDLVILAAVPDAGSKGLVDAPADRLERMRAQAAQFGPSEVSRAADIVNTGLTEMRGATAPRLQLELICARVLLPGAGDGVRDLHARLDRLERRLAGGSPLAAPPGPGAADAGAAVAGGGREAAREAIRAARTPDAPAPPAPPAATLARPADATPAGAGAPPSQPPGPGAPAPQVAPAASAPPAGAAPPPATVSPPPSAPPADAAPPPAAAPAATAPAGELPAAAPAPQVAPAPPAAATPPARQVPPAAPAQPAEWPKLAAVPPPAARPQAPAEPAPPAVPAASAAPGAPPARPTSTPAVSRPAAPADPPPAAGTDITTVRRLWPDILEVVKTRRRYAWMLLMDGVQVAGLDNGVLVLAFAEEGKRRNFLSGSDEVLRAAIGEVLRVDWRLDAVLDPARASARPGDPGATAGPAHSVSHLRVVPPPSESPAPPASSPPPAPMSLPAPPAYAEEPGPDDGDPWDRLSTTPAAPTPAAPTPAAPTPAAPTPAAPTPAAPTPAARTPAAPTPAAPPPPAPAPSSPPVQAPPPAPATSPVQAPAPAKASPGQASGPDRAGQPSGAARARAAIAANVRQGTAPAAAGAEVDDTAAADDPDADDAGLSGRDLVARELGARVIEEIVHE